MRLKEIINGKKEWHELMDRVKSLPKDYQIVYKEVQNYLYKIWPVELTDSMSLLTGIVDFFEEGAFLGKGVLEITGNDVALFCDALIASSKIHSDT